MIEKKYIRYYGKELAKSNPDIKEIVLSAKRAGMWIEVTDYMFLNARMRSRRSKSSSGRMSPLRRTVSAGGSSAKTGRLRAARRCMRTTFTVTR